MYDDFIFHEDATVAANGNTYNNISKRIMTIEIYGTSSTRTVTFYGKSFSGVSRPISGKNLNGLTNAINTTGNNELWQFDISGLKGVVMDLTAVSGGNVSVKGRAVS